MASQNLETAQRAIRIISEKFKLDPAQLEERIVGRMSRRIENASDADKELWSSMETEGDTPTAGEMIAFIVDRVKAAVPEKKTAAAVKEICKVGLINGKRG